MQQNKLIQVQNSKNSSTNFSENSTFPIIFLNNQMRTFKSNLKQKISRQSLFKQGESSSTTDKKKSFAQQIERNNKYFHQNQSIKQFVNQKKQNDSKKQLAESFNLTMQQFRKYIGRAEKINKWQMVNLQKSIQKNKKKFTISAKKIRSIIPINNSRANQNFETERKYIYSKANQYPLQISKLKQIYIPKTMKNKKGVSKKIIKNSNKKFQTYQSGFISQEYYESNSINEQQQQKIENPQIWHQLSKITQNSYQQEAFKKNTKNTVLNVSSTLNNKSKKILINSFIDINEQKQIIQKAKLNLSNYIKSINSKLPLLKSNTHMNQSRNVIPANYIANVRPPTTRYVDIQEEQLIEDQMTPMQQLNAIPNISQITKSQNQNKIQQQIKKQEDTTSTNVPSNQKSELIQVPSFREIVINDNQINKLKFLNKKQKTYGSENLREIIQKFKLSVPFYKKMDLDKIFIKRYKNGVYLGQLRKNTQQSSNPIKQGYGTIFYYSGKLYQGQLFNNQKHGKGFQVYPDNSFYQGQFENGHKEGNGRFVWNNGEIYDGQWHQGKRHGSGMWKHSDRDMIESYIGQWFQGKIQGFGVLTNSKGIRYEGQFRNSLKHGQGTQRFQNEDVYIGSYEKDLQNGYGQLYFKNGDIYKGDFKNGYKHGKGVLSEANTGNFYEGEFQNDKKCGFGRYIWKNGDIYQGTFQNQLKHGYGQFRTIDSKVYQGYWLNDNILNENIGKKQKNKKIIQRKAQLISDRTIDIKSPTKTKRKSPNFISPLSKTHKRECGCTKVNHY